MSLSQASIPACDSQHCVTCADEGVEMTVIRVDSLRGLALCADAGGQRCSVETALVDGVAAGDRLLVHAGTAIASLGPGCSGGGPSRPGSARQDRVEAAPRVSSLASQEPVR